MPNNVVFELVEIIDSTAFPGVFYWNKEDAWKCIGNIVDKLVETHKNINIVEFNIDQKRSTVWIKLVDTKTNTVHYRYYEIQSRLVN